MSDGRVWAAIGLCALVTFVIKGTGPLVLGARALPPAVTRVVTLLASALLAALVVTSALADGDRLHVGADTAGVAVAAVLLLRRTHLVVVVVAAAATAALVRQLGVDV